MIYIYNSNGNSFQKKTSGSITSHKKDAEGSGNCTKIWNIDMSWVKKEGRVLCCSGNRKHKDYMAERDRKSVSVAGYGTEG